MAFVYRTSARRDGYIIDPKRIVAVKNRRHDLYDEWRSTIYLDSGQAFPSGERAEEILNRLETK